MLTRRQLLYVPPLGVLLASSPALATGTVPVVASFSILGDLVKNVGGDRLLVETLVGPAGDVHVYEPTPNDARLITGAKIIFINGLGLEGWMTRLVGAASPATPLVEASEDVTPRPANTARGPSRSVPDPHAWQSIANVKLYVARIRSGLINIDPQGQAKYSANAAAYLARLDELERDVRETIGKIPPQRRKVVTNHDAFGYFGDAYGLEFIAAEGVSTDTEPSARDIAKLIAQIKAQKIPAVFLETISDPRLMVQIAQESGARIGGTLYSDALSPPDGPAGTYLDMMRSNVRALGKALQPQVGNCAGCAE